MLHTKSVPTIPYSTTYFPFNVLYTKMRTYCAVQFTLFSLFQVLYTKCVCTIPYSTPYFLFSSTVHLIFPFQVLYTKMHTYCTVQYNLFSLFECCTPNCVPAVHWSTPYFLFSSNVHQNAYLLYSTVHQIFTFSSIVHQMHTYYTLQYTLFSLFK